MASEDEWNRINQWAKKLLNMDDKERYDLMVRVLDCAKNLMEQSVIAFFYIYGLRPAELLHLKKSSFKVSKYQAEDGSEQEEVQIEFPTSKGGRDRYIILNTKTTPFMDIILRYVSTVTLSDWAVYRQFKVPTNFNNIIEKIEQTYYKTYGESICLQPYVFRKFRISYLLANGANNADILSWKGGRSLQVVERSYSFFKPVIKFKTMIK